MLTNDKAIVNSRLRPPVRNPQMSILDYLYRSANLGGIDAVVSAAATLSPLTGADIQSSLCKKRRRPQKSGSTLLYITYHKPSEIIIII